MKKLLVLRTNETPKVAKKTARVVKKQYEKLWGPGTCEVVVLPVESSLDVVVGWDGLALDERDAQGKVD